MMKSPLGLFCIALAFVLHSCGSQQQEPPQSQEEAVQVEPGLKLNNGNKWVVSPEMIVHLHQSQQAVAEADQASEKDFPALASVLWANNEAFIESCNMEGDGHNELHKWLMPYMEHLTALENAGNASDAQLALDDIKGSLRVFEQYFQ